MRKLISLLSLFILLSQTSIFSLEKTSYETSANADIVFNANSLSYGSDSAEFDESKHPFIAIGGMLAFTALLYSYNRFVSQASWAKTGWDEIHKFWTRELKWDNDWYWTNFVLHPYQGGMYYMSARNSNLNQLESFGVTVLGSSIWEYLCETNAPSKNDMVYTTFGAYAVGEMLYRLSQEANEISRLLGVALNPERLWSEYLWGIKQRPNTGNIFELSVSADMGFGKSTTTFTDSTFDSTAFGKKNSERNETFPVFGGLGLDVVYNDPYTHDSNTPYSQFEMLINVEGGKGSGNGALCAYEDLDEKMYYNIRIVSNGSMISRAVQGEKTDTSYGLTFEYDFDWNSFYQISSLAPSFSVRQRIRNPSSKIEWQAHLGGVMLGTSESYYAKRKFVFDSVDISRCYSYNLGAENVLKFKFTGDSGFSAGFDFRGYALYDFENQLVDPLDTGWELFGVLTAGFEIPLTKQVKMGISDELFAKKTFYTNYPDYYQFLNSARIFAKLQLK